MAGGRGNVKVKIRSDFDDRGTREAGRALDRLNTAGRRSMGALGRGVATGGVIAAGGLAVLSKNAIDTASDINESLTKNGVLFGRYAKDIEAFSSTSAASFGLSRKAALEYTGVFGNLFRALGISSKESAGFSTNLTKLAADMASFNNTSIEDALEAIRSGLVGETEPLRRFGVNMQDATLRQEALRLGLVKTTKESLEPQTRALAAQALIIRQTNAAHGDFARTQTGLANQQRILKAEASDLSARFGKALLPAATRLTNYLTSNVSPALKETADDIEAIAKRRDIDISEKIKLSRGAIRQNMRPVVQDIERVLERAQLGERLSSALESGLPKVMEAAGRGGTKAVVFFLKGWWASDEWGKLATLAFLTAKLGGFKAAGGWAAGQFMGSFGKRAAKQQAGVAAAGTAAGVSYGGAFAVAAGPLIATGIAAALNEIAKSEGTDKHSGSSVAGPDSPRNAANALAIKIARLLGVDTSGGKGGRPGETGFLDAAADATGTAGGARRSGRSIPGMRTGPSVPTYRGPAGTAPTAGRGKIIGTPHAGTHNLGDWQSDNAVDIRIEQGSPIVAVEGGKVRKVKIGKNGGGRFAGSQVTIDGESGQNYFYAHLRSVSVRAGQTVRAGEQIGTSGSANGVPHLHFATEKGDPRSVRLAGGQRVITRLNPRQRMVEEAARKYGIDPAVLWGVYGAESNFGKNPGRSPAGAMGPFQLMPGTAKELGVKNRMSFEESVFAAARYLARYESRGTRGMLAAYNAGPGGDPNNPETRAYIPKVLALAKRFPTIDLAGGDGVPIDPTDMRALNESLANARILPIARALRRNLAGPSLLMGRYGRRADTYGGRLSQAQGAADLVDEDIGTASGRAARIGELTGIRDLTLNRGFAMQQRLSAIRGAIRQYATAVKKLRASLKKAPSGQRGTIKARIEKYLGRIRDLQAEARELGADIEAGSTELLGVMGDITSTDVEGRAEQADREGNARRAVAALTPGFEDDVAVASADFGAAQSAYNSAVASGDPLRIFEAATNLKQAGDTLKDAGENLKAAAEQAIEDRLNVYDADLIRAQILTPDDTADDLAALVRKGSDVQGLVDAAFASNNVADILKYGPMLLGIRGEIKSLRDTVDQKTSELLELEKQKSQELQRRLNTSEAQFKQYQTWMIETVVGGVGGRVGLAGASVSAAGRVATY